MQPGRIVAVRLSPEMAERLRRLQASFNLPPSTVLKLVIQAHLEKPFDQQVEVVTTMIVKPRKLERLSRPPLNTPRPNRLS